ncbi:hypothetical protein [Magnetospirillum sp. ME-1]|nr:hypothetical protein [Magnetospirillum sp. ME-1]
MRVLMIVLVGFFVAVEPLDPPTIYDPHGPYPGSSNLDRSQRP